jgi:hypothetical protein
LPLDPLQRCGGGVGGNTMDEACRCAKRRGGRRPPPAARSVPIGSKAWRANGLCADHEARQELALAAGVRGQASC